MSSPQCPDKIGELFVMPRSLAAGHVRWRAILESVEGTTRHPTVVSTMKRYATMMNAAGSSRWVISARKIRPTAIPMVAVAPSRNTLCDRDVYKRTASAATNQPTTRGHTTTKNHEAPPLTP